MDKDISQKKYTPTGARRSGDDYQDLVALEVMVDWLSHPDLYQAIYVEAEDAEYLDDVKAVRADGSIVLKQVKFAAHPENQDDDWTWERLTSQRTGKNGKVLPSLIEKWGTSLKKVTAEYSVHEAFLVSNRPMSRKLRAATTADKHIDLRLIDDDEMRATIVQQLGDEDSAVQFFSTFEFDVHAPDLDAWEEGLVRRFLRLGGTSEGWLHLKDALRSWVRNADLPVAGGRITLGEIKSVAQLDPNAPLLADVAALRALTAQSLQTLDASSSISSRDIQVFLDRECVGVICSKARQGQLLIVGEPGAGKTGALITALSSLQNEGDVLLLQADQWVAASVPALQGELGLQQDILKTLDDWPGEGEVYLVIEALDSARSPSALHTFTEIVRKALSSGSRWRVLVTIRKFDLRYNSELQSMFHGEPDREFHDPEFASVRHINVPLLTEEETNQVKAQSTTLGLFLTDASEALKELLRNPFNLRIAAEILTEGGDCAGLAQTTTQIELLERYWEVRVVRNDLQGDARETVLATASKAMLKDKMNRVERRDVVAGNPSVSEPLNEMLHSHVLVEWLPPGYTKPERAVLAYSHQILYDYAVARLILRGRDDRFVRCLSSEPDLLLTIRPSIAMHFQYVWGRDPSRHSFWNLTFQVAEAEDIREIGKIIGPMAAAQEARDISDFFALLDALEDPGRRTVALHVLTHVRGAIMSSDRPMTGNGSVPCCALLEHASRSGNTEVILTLTPLLMHITAQPTLLTREEASLTGTAARRFLEKGWEGEP